MTLNIRVIALLAILACALLAPRGAVADASTAPDNRVYAAAMMSGALGWNHSSGHGAGFSLGLGKPLSEHFGLELDFQRYDIQLKPDYGGFDAAEKTYGINGLFFLHRGPRWTPYLEFGAGRVNSAFNDISSNSAYISAGAGFFWRVVDHLSIRGDLRFNDLPNGIGSAAHSGAIQYPVASFGIITQFGEVSRGGTRETQSSPSPASPPSPASSASPVSPAPADSDGDGVPDDLDQCLDTPSGVRVDRQGCPLDTDNDGIADYLDQCPDTPPGVKVDANGCPIRPSLKFPSVQFAFDSSRLTVADKHTLDKVAGALRKAPHVELRLVGHTDSIGSSAYNRKLSAARAASVKRYLAAQGISADRLKTRGDGESHPVAPNDTAAGRAKNRRVELQVLGPGGREAEPPKRGFKTTGRPWPPPPASRADACRGRIAGGPLPRDRSGGADDRCPARGFAMQPHHRRGASGGRRRTHSRRGIVFPWPGRAAVQLPGASPSAGL